MWKSCQKARCGRWKRYISPSLWHLASAMNVFPPVHTMAGVYHGLVAQDEEGNFFLCRLPFSLGSFFPEDEALHWFLSVGVLTCKIQAAAIKQLQESLHSRHLGQQTTQEMLFCLIFQTLPLPLVMWRLARQEFFFNGTCFSGIQQWHAIFTNKHCRLPGDSVVNKTAGSQSLEA